MADPQAFSLLSSQAMNNLHKNDFNITVFHFNHSLHLPSSLPATHVIIGGCEQGGV